MSNEMTVAESHDIAFIAESQQIAVSGAVSLMPVPQMQAVLAEYTERRQSFRTWLLSQLTEGVHYGIPPGCEPKRDAQGRPLDFTNKVVRPEQWSFRPSLYKAGADLVVDLMMLDPTFSPDAESWKMLGAIDGLVVIQCRLLSRGANPFFPAADKGQSVGEGRGSAQAGQKRRDANGAIKIAQKSAKIDAVINTLGLSDLFTQDLEDKPRAGQSPDADPDAPKVGTRAERATGQTVSAAVLNELFGDYCSAGHDSAAFHVWVSAVLKTDRPMKKRAEWTAADLAACRKAIS